MALARGARLAEPGEFTMRAFLNGRIDLTQAEAVRDLIDSQTLYQAKSRRTNSKAHSPSACSPSSRNSSS